MNCHTERYASTKCRLCLQDDNILFDIFEENIIDGITPAYIISRLLDPQLSKDDGFPQVCCEECIRKLRIFKSMNSLESSPSFMLFREQSSIAKAVFDCSYYDYNEVQQHSPISEDHSPLCLDLDSYASLEEQKWHYNDILKAVAQILEAMNGEERGLKYPLEERLCNNEIRTPSQQSPKESEELVKTENAIEEPKKSSAVETNSRQTSKKRKERAVKSPRRRKCQIAKTSEGWSGNRFQCPTCGITCAGKQDLNKHLVVHTQDRPFPCPVCKNTYRHQRNLNRHLKTHSPVKDFCCSHCHKTFSNLDFLNSHLITHDTRESFSCSLCGKLFKRKALLKLHMKRHNKIRPHKCKICGLTFTQRSDLTKHMPAHSGLREFSCSVCKKQFSYKRNLKEHERIHRKDKQFECAHCGELWAQKAHLIKHFERGCPLQRIRVKVE